MKDEDDDSDDDAAETRGMSAEALLAGARAAHAREQRQAGVTTAERVRLGRWLAAIKLRAAFLAEGCASLEAWAQEKLGIRTSLTNCYVRIAALPLALVDGYDLGLNKLDRLVRCPGPVRAGLVSLAPGWSEPVLAAAVAAARQVYHKTEDVDAALAAARATAAKAMDKGRQRSAALRGKGGKRPKLDIGAALDQIGEILEAQVEALAKQPEALQAKAERLYRVFARIGLANPLAGGEKAKKNNWIDESVRSAAEAPKRPVAAPAPVAAGAAAPPGQPSRSAVLDDAPIDDDDEPEDELGADPDAAVVSLADLMKALREGQSEEDAAHFADALYGLLANHNPEWEAISRREVEKVAALALRARRFPEAHLREWARQVMAPTLADRWQLVFNSYLCCPDLPDFTDNLDDLRGADLPEEYLVQVREASESYPPIDRSPKDPAELPAWMDRAEAEINAFMKTLPAQVW